MKLLHLGSWILSCRSSVFILSLLLFDFYRSSMFPPPGGGGGRGSDSKWRSPLRWDEGFFGGFFWRIRRSESAPVQSAAASLSRKKKIFPPSGQRGEHPSISPVPSQKKKWMSWREDSILTHWVSLFSSQIFSQNAELKLHFNLKEQLFKMNNLFILGKIWWRKKWNSKNCWRIPPRSRNKAAALTLRQVAARWT